MDKTVLVADKGVPGIHLFEPPGDLYGVHLAGLSRRGGRYGIVNRMGSSPETGKTVAAGSQRQ